MRPSCNMSSNPLMPVEALCGVVLGMRLSVNVGSTAKVGRPCEPTTSLSESAVFATSSISISAPAHRMPSDEYVGGWASYDANPPATSRVQLDGRTNRLPTGMTHVHVAGVEAGIAQGNGGTAPHVEAVRAVHHDRLLPGQLAHPFADTLRVAPGHPLCDIPLPRDKVLRARIDELQ